MCGHPMRVCRDKSTMGSWTVVEDVCLPSQVAQAVSENNTKAGGKRGVVLSTKRS